MFSPSGAVPFQLRQVLDTQCQKSAKRLKFQRADFTDLFPHQSSGVQRRPEGNVAGPSRYNKYVRSISKQAQERENEDGITCANPLIMQVHFSHQIRSVP
jgi:hypothetical protein